MDSSSADIGKLAADEAAYREAQRKRFLADFPSKEQLHTTIAEAEADIELHKAEFDKRMNEARVMTEKLGELKAKKEKAEAAYMEQRAAITKEINRAEAAQKNMHTAVRMVNEAKVQLANYKSVEFERKRVLGDAA